MFLHVSPGGILGQQRINGNNDPGSAKSALRSVHIHHGTLDRVETVLDGTNALDGGYVASIGGKDWH